MLLPTFYNRMHSIFLNQFVEGSSFEISSPEDITWKNIVQSISSFSNFHTGQPVINKLGGGSLTISFPNIQRRYMWIRGVAMVETTQQVVQNNAEAVAVLTTVVGGSGVLVGLVVQNQEKEKDRIHEEKLLILKQDHEKVVQKNQHESEYRIEQLRLESGNGGNVNASNRSYPDLSSEESPMKAVMERVPETLEKVRQIMKEEEKALQESENLIVHGTEQKNVKASSLLKEDPENGLTFFDLFF